MPAHDKLANEVLAKINMDIRADGEVILSKAVGYATASGLSEVEATKAVKSYMGTLVKRGIATRRKGAGLAMAWIHA